MDLAQLGAGTLLGLGISIGYLRGSLQALRKTVTQIHDKLDKLDDRLDSFEVRLVKIEVPHAINPSPEPSPRLLRG
jgi:hypothetical protein